MSDTITAILVVPEAGDPRGLLADGPHKSSPPTAYTVRYRETWHSADFEQEQEEEAERALVLAWDGKPNPQGQGHLYLILAPNGAVLTVGYPSMGLPTELRQANWWARYGTRNNQGRIVYLNASGQEVER